MQLAPHARRLPAHLLGHIPRVQRGARRRSWRRRQFKVARRLLDGLFGSPLRLPRGNVLGIRRRTRRRDPALEDIRSTSILLRITKPQRRVLLAKARLARPVVRRGLRKFGGESCDPRALLQNVRLWAGLKGTPPPLRKAARGLLWGCGRVESSPGPTVPRAQGRRHGGLVAAGASAVQRRPRRVRRDALLRRRPFRGLAGDAGRDCEARRRRPRARTPPAVPSRRRAKANRKFRTNSVQSPFERAKAPAFEPRRPPSFWPRPSPVRSSAFTLFIHNSSPLF